MKTIAIAASLLAAVWSGTATAATVTFDDAAGNAAVFNGFGTLDVQGLHFAYSGPGYASVWDGNAPNSNGTNNLILGYDPTVGVVITRTGGGLFSLASIDLAISFYSAATNANILVNGNSLAITDSLTTYALNLTNVSSVTITGIDADDGYWTGDNLVFSASGAVPEPASWALMIGGFGLAGAAMRRRRAAVRVTYA